MIDRELPTRAHQARREPQIAAANGLLGRPGCRRLASSGEPTDDRPFRSRHLGNPGLCVSPTGDTDEQIHETGGCAVRTCSAEGFTDIRYVPGPTPG
jgi:hypothetical protein